MKRVYLALIVSLPFIVAPEAKKEKPEPPVLTCHISADATCKLGKAPKVSVKITNRTGHAVYLVGSLDGSDCKMRYPHAYFEVIGPSGQSAVRGIGRCGNTNPLREKDFVKVAANKSFDPYASIDNHGFFGAHQLMAQNFAQPGKYRIRFIYSTQAPRGSDWRETPRTNRPLAQNLATLLKAVPKTKLISNEIVVEVKK